MRKGEGVSAGIGIGQALIYRPAPLTYDRYNAKDAASELKRLRDAMGACAEIARTGADRLRRIVGPREAEIVAAKALMLTDPYVKGGIEQLIASGSMAEEAVIRVCDMFESAFLATGDESTMQRAADVRDLRDGLLRQLTGVPEPDFSDAPDHTILVALELPPSVAGGLDPARIAGIVTEKGGKIAHSAILARALGIPCVMGLAGIAAETASGDELIADGTTGLVLVRPSGEEKAFYEAKKGNFQT
ncbi:MAG: hypothetical protein LBQ97_07760 [Fusobacteriaceae bacterium]|jgi:phosphotransferase system enzyme I (PtsI)|nr:hypothetical protein [Fusobacteriaceae bacterium]